MTNWRRKIKGIREKAILRRCFDPGDFRQRGIGAGKLNLWTYDSQHGSSAGYMLTAHGVTMTAMK